MVQDGPIGGTGGLGNLPVSYLYDNVPSSTGHPLSSQFQSIFLTSGKVDIPETTVDCCVSHFPVNPAQLLREKTLN